MRQAQRSQFSRRAAVRTGAAGVALAAVAAVSPRGVVAQDSAEVPEVVTEFLAAYEAGDVDGVLALFAPDGVYELEGSGVALTGEDELRFLHESLFEGNEDITFTDVSGFQAGDHVAAEATWTATNVYDAPGGTPGPNEVTFKFALIGEVTDGLFSRLAVYYDTLREQVQTGVLEPIEVGTPPAGD